MSKYLMATAGLPVVLFLAGSLISFPLHAAGNCKDSVYVAHVRGLEDAYRELGVTRSLQESMRGFLQEADSLSDVSFAMNGYTLEETRARWLGLGSERVPVGTVFSSRASHALCQRQPDADAAGREIRRTLDHATPRMRGVSAIDLYRIDAGQVRELRACDPAYFMIDIKADAVGAGIGDWVACNRPGALLGSYQSLSDGSRTRWAEFNPFESEGWCRTAADMDAEVARLQRSCPGAGSVVLVQKEITARLAVDLLGEETLLGKRH